MLDLDMLIKHIGCYCDAIWEFDRRTGKLYVHYDRVAPQLIGKWTEINEVIRTFKEDCGVTASEGVWQKYLNSGYMTGFFESGKTDETFEVRFNSNNDKTLYWYSMRVERLDDETLIISAKDMNTVFRYRSIYESAKNAFDFIISIDALTDRYTVIHTTLPGISMQKEYDYNDMVRGYISNSADAGGKAELFDSMSVDSVKRQLEKRTEHVVFTGIRIDGKTRYKKLTFSYSDQNKRFITLACLDVSGMAARYEKLLEEIRNDSNRDRLTGAFNRNYYEENLRKRAFSGGVAVFDIDDFKLYNDVYGHKAGDEVLIKAADVINRCMRSCDMLVRFGGDEFLLLMPGAGQALLEHMLETIRRSISLATVSGFENIGITLSSGGVVCKNETVSDAVFGADRMMYRAKATKNSYATERTVALPEAENDTAAGGAERQQILIVDDSLFNRELLSDVLRDEFDILEAENGRQCMEMLEGCGTDISLVLLDIVMPVMNGFEVLSAMKDGKYDEDIPVIMITADSTDANIRRAFDLGVADYISRPYDAAVIKRRIRNIVRLYSKQRRLASIISRNMHEKEQNSRMTIDMLSSIIGYKSGEGGYHAKHIRKITAMLLEALTEHSDKYSLTWNERDIISRASVFHDVGKLGINAEILNKPGKLTPEEFEEIKKHTIIGENILRGKMLKQYKNEPLIETAAQICRWHHERYDGSGYPDGLCGDDIPIAAQVVSLADVYDALVSNRVYKEPIPSERAVEMIRSGECGAFNPILLDCLSTIKGRLQREVYNDSDWRK